MAASRSVCNAFAVVAFAALPLPAARGQVLKSLPPALGSTTSFGQSIDAAGNVVGYSLSKPTLWRPAGLNYVGEALPLPAGTSWGGANFIIPSGDVVAGYVQPQDQSTATATIWTASSGGGGTYSPTLLPAPPAAALTDAYSANAGGEVAGFFETADEATGAVAWTPTGAGGAYAANVLPKLPGWTDTAATAINSAGNLAGYTFGHPLDIVTAAVWQKNGSGYVAKNVLSADSAVVTAMNDNGTGRASMPATSRWSWCSTKGSITPASSMSRSARRTARRTR